jgi:hypothetical protein
LGGRAPQLAEAAAELDNVLEAVMLAVAEAVDDTGQAIATCGGVFPPSPPMKTYEPDSGTVPWRPFILVQTPLVNWTLVQAVLSTFATHEARQSSTVALLSVPIMLGVRAALSQDSLKPEYASWFVSPCAQACAIGRSPMHCVAEDVAEEIVDEVSEAVTDGVIVGTDDESEVTDAAEVVEDGTDEDVDETQGTLT